MTEHQSRDRLTKVRVPSVSEVAKIVRTSDDPVIAKRRPQLLTTLRRLQRHGGADVATVPFVAPALRAALDRMTPAATGLSKKSLQNDCSNLRFLLDHLGLGGLRRYKVPLTGAYLDLLQRITDRHEKSALSQFQCFASVQGIALDAVDDAFADTYRAALFDEDILKDPADTYRRAIRAWNRARDRWPALGLQQLTYPLKRRGWGLPWSSFPDTLVDEIEHYFVVHSEAGDLFDPDAPDVLLKPRTIETQRDWLRVLASAAVRSGVAVEDLVSLADLVCPRTVERALRWYVNDHGAKLTEYVVMLAVQAQTMAKHACRLDEDDVDALGKLIKRLRLHKDARGDDAKRLARLVQFEDRRAVLRMLALGAHVVRAVQARPTTSRRDALDIALALAHELLLATTLRRGNLIALNLDAHLIWKDKGWRLVHIPDNEVKNEESLHKELPPHVVELLQLYLATYRPLLCNGETSWLFPGREGRHKRPGTFTIQYKRFLADWTKIDATPHLVRSFCDMLYMEHNPEGGEVMRRQLGHRSSETRLKHCADPRSRGANRAYLELLIEERDKALDEEDLFE